MGSIGVEGAKCYHCGTEDYLTEDPPPSLKNPTPGGLWVNLSKSHPTCGHPCWWECRKCPPRCECPVCGCGCFYT